MNIRIDSLRGLACLLLVGYHVVGADPSQGLRIADGAVRWFNDALVYLRMPLFTFLSGLVYGLRPSDGKSPAFLVGKARRLWVPMLVVGTLFALLQALTPGANSRVDAWHLLHIQPVAHFWFVQALFWVFLSVWCLERCKLITTGKAFTLVFGLACGLYLAFRGWHWLGIEGAIYLLPYFLAGLACSRFPLQAHLSKGWVGWALAAIAAGAVVSIGMPLPNPDRRTVAMLLAGIALCLLCLGSKMEVRWLARIGRHSYAIFLWHVFFTASVRIALDRIGIDAIILNLLAGVVLGMTGPMLMERCFARFKGPALLLFGRRAADRPCEPHKAGDDPRCLPRSATEVPLRSAAH